MRHKDNIGIYMQGKFMLLTTAAMILLFEFCSAPKSEEDLLIGKWRAFWETSGDGLINLSKDDLTMHGFMTFDTEGKVTIDAFGHEGCIFSSDTLTHQLNWKLEEGVLRFIDQEDDHGLPYKIQNMQKEEIQLKLLEDIYLTLKR